MKNQNGLLNKVKNKENANEQKHNSFTNNSPNNSVDEKHEQRQPTQKAYSNFKPTKPKKNSNLDRVKKLNKHNATNDASSKPTHTSNPLKKVQEKEGIVYDEKQYDLVDIYNETSTTKKSSLLDKVLDRKKTKAEIDLDNKIKEQEKRKSDDYDADEYELEYSDLIETRRQIRKERKQKYFNKIGIVALLVACFYVVFLIYGLFNTPYVYNDKGKVVPESYTVEEVRRLNEFNKVFNQYKKIRVIYEHILNLNYRFDAQAEDAMIVAADYESEIKNITTMVNQTQALDVPESYNQIVSLLDSWLVSYQDNNSLNDSAKAYCYNMSVGISQNKQSLVDDCSSYGRGVLYSEFLQITQNLTSIGKTIKGADIQTLYEWSPEKYVNEQIGSKNSNVGADAKIKKDNKSDTQNDINTSK